MKLLFVGTSKGGGGTESHFITLARAMTDAGHVVSAVVYADGSIYQGLQNSQVTLHTSVFRNVLDPRGYRDVWRVAKSFEPDWIVGSFSKEYWPLAALAMRLKVPLALFKHMDFPMRPLTHKHIPRLASRFIVISEFMRERFIARGVPPERLHVLYNPLDMNHFQPDPELRCAMREQLGLAGEDVLVGYAGAFHPGKGIFILADALDKVMDKNPRLKAIWIGQGEAEPALSARLARSPFKARHLRQDWVADMRPFYAAMDLLALPSIESDTFGRVSIEAQACGVPVLGSRLGGIPETLQAEHTGRLVEPGNVPAWQATLAALVQHDDARQRMASAGPEHVAAKFDAGVIARRFTEMLSSPV